MRQPHAVANLRHPCLPQLPQALDKCLVRTDLPLPNKRQVREVEKLFQVSATFI